MKPTGHSRISKDLMIGEIEKELKSRPLYFVVQHGAVAANAMDKLRVKLRAHKARYMAVKNSLGKKALERCGAKELSSSLGGSCGFAFTSGDPAMSSKILVDFAKENEQFKIQAGMMDGHLISLNQVRTLASLPSREVLIARVLGGMQAPLSRLVGVLSGTVRRLVTVIDAVAKKKE